MIICRWLYGKKWYVLFRHLPGGNGETMKNIIRDAVLLVEIQYKKVTASVGLMLCYLEFVIY